MVFPGTPLGLAVEIFVNGAWTGITSSVLGRDNLVISRGTSREGADVDRSTMRGSLNNQSGNFSPRKPTGIYYGQIGRNTPIRARLTSGPAGYLLMADPDRANTPDSANLSITGDIDIRIDLQLDSWAALQGIANKLLNPSQRSWVLYLNANGTLSFAWSVLGSAMITATSTAAVSPPASGRLAIRVTLDVDNGAAGNTVTFYTATNIDSSWVQLGSTVVTAGTTSIFDSTAALEIGGSQGVGASDDIAGRVYGFQMLQGIGGTLRADVDFNDELAGVASFVDGTSNTWTLINESSIVTPAVRFVGEVSEWPQKWDLSGKDVYVPIEASGILRRLTQGATPLKSTMYRGITSLTNLPKAYWPCEDGPATTEIASGIGGPPMSIRRVTAGETVSTFDGLDSSAPILFATGSEWKGDVPTYTGNGIIQFTFWVQVPTTATSGQVLATLYTTGSIVRWEISYEGGGGDLRIRAFSPSGATVLDPGVLNANIDTFPTRIGLQLSQDGTSVRWDLEALLRSDPDGFLLSYGGTIAFSTISRATRVVINPGGDVGEVAVGHITVENALTPLEDLVGPIIAFRGETAGRRIKRLCAEEGITFRGIGLLDQTATMGPQRIATLVTLLRDAANADGGVLFEPRDMLGFAYKTRESHYLQRALLEMTYSSKHLSGFEPTDDDQNLRNDITVTRFDGSSARATLDSGRLSTQAPPNGVGTYDEQISLNLETDAQLPDEANWLLLLGTIDEARFPLIKIDLTRGVWVASPTLTTAAQDLDVGDRLTVASPPAWLPPDKVSQRVLGFTETLGNFTYRIDINCAPETPWSQVGLWDVDVRWSSDGSTLAAGVASGATSLSVATPSGPLWSHSDGDFDIRIGGEVMTVTAVTGASSPQTFTVTRSVNSVVKEHLAGAAVELAPPRVWAR